MNKLVWVYTIAAILAFNCNLAFAGTMKAAVPSVKKEVQALLQTSERASFEDISEIQTKLDSIRKRYKKMDKATNQKVTQIQTRLDKLMNELAVAMK